jgi:hypothetical protein
MYFTSIPLAKYLYELQTYNNQINRFLPQHYKINFKSEKKGLLGPGVQKNKSQYMPGFIMSTHWKAGESQHVHCHHDKHENQAKPANSQAYSDYMGGTHMSHMMSTYLGE